MLYEEPSREDGYFRDACVFREEIDIFDTMSAAILYENGVQVSYSLNTFMPIEGYHLAFNGTKGRVEIRQYERQAWETPDEDEILVMRNFDGVERIRVPHGRAAISAPISRCRGCCSARHARSARPARRRARRRDVRAYRRRRHPRARRSGAP